MRYSSRIEWLRRAVCLAVVLVPVVATAADRSPKKPPPDGELVEIFSGIASGQIDVQLIAKDSKQCRLFVENKTDRPLNVMLPRAFAGVPVLAQAGMPMLGPGGRGLNPVGRNRPQGIGMGPGMMGPGLFAPGMGRGMMNVLGGNIGGNIAAGNRRPNMFPGPLFNVPPEKVGKLKLDCVCLDFGRPQPRPRIKYRIEPIHGYTDKPGVAELCDMLGRGELTQRVAQLAAWHLANGKSWDQLAEIRHKVTFGTQPTYSRKELQSARQAAEKAVQAAEERAKPHGGKADSLAGS